MTIRVLFCYLRAIVSNNVGELHTCVCSRDEPTLKFDDKCTDVKNIFIINSSGAPFIYTA